MPVNNSQDSLYNSYKSISIWRTIYTTFYMLLTDIVVHGGIIPVLGVYFAGCFVKMFNFGFTSELILCITCTFFMIYLALGTLGETNYWKHLFNFEQMHGLILEIRDMVNTFILVLSVIFVGRTIQSMVEDKAIKQTVPVSEGIGFISLKYTILYAARLVGMEQSVADSIGVKPPRAGTLTDPSFGENEVYEHGAALMLSFSIVASCVCKLCYFNTLFTYLRAMEIFLSLRPTFRNKITYIFSTYHNDC
ncbi:unnamed protein product [Orchesella dallaii]|uniref:Uncharacterized protein n=1 Tax=Orchesella dallaii TaxID=48710 RepID=A0ABP1Q5I5_9HEXA